MISFLHSIEKTHPDFELIGIDMSATSSTCTFCEFFQAHNESEEPAP